MHSRNIKPIVFLAALLLAAAVPGSGQSWAGRGRLQGSVKDESEKPVEGAKVTLRVGTGRVDPKAEGPAVITTDKNGKWSILGLAGGAWGILIEKPGFMASEGQVKVNEFAIAQPINIVLKVPPKEVIQQAEQESAAGQAKTAIERGNALMNQSSEADTLVTKCRSELREGQTFETECRSQIEKAQLSAATLSQARAAYEEGLSKLEDKSLHPSILRAIANTYYKEDKIDQAVDVLKRSLDVDPADDDAVTLQLLVNILVGAGREPEAQTYMARLPQGTTVDPNTLLNLGITSFNSGKMDEAMAQFDRVVKENPDLPDAYYYRALCYLNKGKNAEAKADLQKLLQLDPGSKYAKDAQDFLKDLK